MLDLCSFTCGCTTDHGSSMVTTHKKNPILNVPSLLLIVGQVIMPNVYLRPSSYIGFHMAPCLFSISSRTAHIIGALLHMLGITSTIHCLLPHLITKYMLLWQPLWSVS